MFWTIFLSVLSMALVASATIRFRDKEIVAGVFTILLAMILAMGAAKEILDISRGEIGKIGALPANSIYKIEGHVKTEKGIILIVSDGEQNMRVVWLGNSNLPNNARYARVNNGKFEAVDARSPETQPQDP